MASWQVGNMSRTRHYRDLIAWQKAMELARAIYTLTEEFPKSETFGLRMQLRRSAVNVASHIAEAHGRLNDAEMRKGLGAARAAINELQTQTELAASLGFFNEGASTELLDLGTRVAKLINALLGVLEPESEPANSRRDSANLRKENLNR
jgi:four helix bundle protein